MDKKEITKKFFQSLAIFIGIVALWFVFRWLEFFDTYLFVKKFTESMGVISFTISVSILFILISPDVYQKWKKLMYFFIPASIALFLFADTNDGGWALPSSWSFLTIFYPIVTLLIAFIYVISHAIYSKIQLKKEKTTFGA